MVNESPPKMTAVWCSISIMALAEEWTKSSLSGWHVHRQGANTDNRPQVGVCYLYRRCGVTHPFTDIIINLAAARNLTRSAHRLVPLNYSVGR